MLCSFNTPVPRSHVSAPEQDKTIVEKEDYTSLKGSINTDTKQKTAFDVCLVRIFIANILQFCLNSKSQYVHHKWHCTSSNEILLLSRCWQTFIKD